jgi:hypothetical protein
MSRSRGWKKKRKKINQSINDRNEFCKFPRFQSLEFAKIKAYLGVLGIGGLSRGVASFLGEANDEDAEQEPVSCLHVHVGLDETLLINLRLIKP